MKMHNKYQMCHIKNMVNGKWNQDVKYFSPWRDKGVEKKTAQNSIQTGIKKPTEV